MAPHEGEEDPAVYKSSSNKAKASSSSEMENEGGSDEEDDTDGPLLTSQPGFNRLLLVLRDEGVLRFVKYVSATARGSRWDIYGEWQVGAVEEEQDGDGDEEEDD